MEHVEVCRICLILDVKMYHLQTFPLSTYMEPMGINLLSTAELPPYVCYECANLLKKWNEFRQRCFAGQSVLYSMLQSRGQITLQEVKQLNREELNLSSHLVTTGTIIIDSTETCDIKKELNLPEIFFPDVKYDSLASANIKEEEESAWPLQLVSSDDDEPLSLHKSIKEEKVEKKVKRKKKEPESAQPNQQSSSSTDATETEATKKRALPKKPRVRKPYVRKEVKKGRRTANTGGVSDDDEDELETYVTILKLTEEEQMEEVQKRKESDNYVNAPFQCDQCFKGFINQHAFKHHLERHDPSAGDIECHICKSRFKHKRAFSKHAANHANKFACKSCPYVSKTATQAKQHHRWHKGVTYKCQFCDEVSTKWTSYLSHVRIKHPSSFICGICGYSFVSKLGLSMHKTMMHKDGEESEVKTEPTGPYCKECDVRFATDQAHKRHMVTSAKHLMNTETKGCRVCGETFSSPEELRQHHRKMHARKRPKNYGKKPNESNWPSPCEHCGELIPTARELWVHFRRVHPDKPYPIQKNHVCDICGKSFRGNAFLNYHKRTHFNERNYKCSQCPKAFFNRTNLQMHEKVHSDHRPYPCDVCFKAFKGKGALDRHYRCHTGVKPYECEVCGKAFSQANSRKLHVRTVHLKQPAPYISKNRMERRRQNPPPPATANNPYILY